ncbi:MAG: adenylate/guanylate cyclase domain-containing protein, partial [Betaproteobacteria bacterium]
MASDGEVCGQCRIALPPGARFCPGCGARAPATATTAGLPAGERRQVAVIFADLSGYTRLASTLDAEDVHRVLTRYFALADGAIERLGGTVDKHVGDAVMGVFGAPVAHGNDIERALRAALEIHAGMAALSADLGRPLAAHVGIASGEVVAAATGSDLHSTYTVTGDAVNLASRLTDVAAAGETAISADVQRAAAALADVEAVGEVELRGFARPQRVWKLRALRVPGTARAPLIGRDTERRRFAALLAEVAVTRIGAVAMVAAEPGMGKTRLAEAFVASALAEGAYCHSATILDFGARQGEDALHALACSLLDIPLHVDGAVRRDALSQAIAQARAGDEHGACLADLVNAPQLSGSVYDAMDNDARQQGKLQALSDIVVRAAARAPCMLLVEDVHWASAWVLEGLRTIVACTAHHPVVLVMTTRREAAAYAEHWAPERTTRFELAPLAPADALALARIHFAASPDLAQRCVDRAQGNPLFLVQLIRSGSDDDAVPASIQSVVLSRLDRLPPADKRALQAAAVIGQRFSLELLRSLIGEDGYMATEPLERDLVRPVADADGELMFAHALIRDGAYASLLHSARRELHRAAAAWFAGRDVVLRARHLDRAEDPAAAAACLDAARAEAAALRDDTALALARRGGEIAADAATRYALATLEGDLEASLGRAAESIAAHERALAAAATERERALAWIGVAAAHRLTSAIGPGLAALDEAARFAGENPRDNARIHYLRGSFRFAQGDVERCRAEHERALALATQAGDRECEVQALSGLADVLYAQGRWQSARAMFERCVDLLAAAGATRLSIMNRCMIALIDAHDGEIDKAVEAFEQARALAHDLRNRMAEAMAQETCGMVLVLAERYGEAREVLHPALALARAVGARRFETVICYSLARVCLHDGDVDAARRHAQEAWRLTVEVGPRFAGPIALGALALVAGTAAERDRALSEGEALLEQGCISHCYLSFYRDAIEIALERGDWDEADRYASAFDAYTRAEPLRLCSLFIARARALAAAGRGTAELRALLRVREEAAALR